MKEFIKKHYLTIIGGLLSIATFILESKKEDIENKNLRKEIKEEILKELTVEGD